MTHLTGIAWNHGHGFTSIATCAHCFCELDSGVEIIWKKRSLPAFADKSIAKLTERYDFLILNHPWAGFAARSKVISPLNDDLSEPYLIEQEKDPVGKSYENYSYNNKQWALSNDAAPPVTTSRPHLFEKKELLLSKTFDNLIELSKTAKVAILRLPQDTLMNFYMICSALCKNVCASKKNIRRSWFESIN